MEYKNEMPLLEKGGEKKFDCSECEYLRDEGRVLRCSISDKIVFFSDKKSYSCPKPFIATLMAEKDAEIERLKIEKGILLKLLFVSCDNSVIDEYIREDEDLENVIIADDECVHGEHCDDCKLHLSKLVSAEATKQWEEKRKNEENKN